jgi:thiol-disulfide isomerase/thioredoxin
MKGNRNYKMENGNYNKLMIFITIFIVVILIAVMCYSMRKSEMFSSGKELHYYSLSTCPHCTDFDPVWQQFQKKTDKCHKYVVDEDDKGKENADKYNVHSFPTLLIVDNGKPVEEVNDRTCGAMREMCKKHNIPCTVVC